MTIKEDLIQGVRAVLKAAFSLTDAQVMPARHDGTRPPTALLTVDVPAGGGRVVGLEHRNSTSGGAPASYVWTEREAPATIRAYGDTAIEYLNLLQSRLAREDVLAVTETSGITIQIAGQPVGVPVMLDGLQWEERAALDIVIGYGHADTTETHTEAAVVTVDLDLDVYEGDPAPLERTITVNL